MSRFAVLLIASLAILRPSHAQSSPGAGCDAAAASLNCKLLDDFESDTTDAPPHRWRNTKNRSKLIRLTHPDAMDSEQHAYVREEEGNRFARIYTEGRAFRIVRSHKYGLNWHVGKRPYLRWAWRAKMLPTGANEKQDSSNDTGGALYVTFETDWLGRPKSIKYTYSTTLPVGTTVDYGPLKVLVVASKREQGLDQWSTHERNVVEDYKRLFGEKPDKTPLAVMLWSDSNTMNSTARVDFDDIMVLSGPSPEKKATSSK